MISGITTSITGTQIIISNIGDGRQLTVYSNQIVLGDRLEPVVMILPFPNKNNNIKVLETVNEDMKCFDNINKCFIEQTFGIKSRSCSGTSSKRTLEVLRAGNYRYSIARGIEQLNMLDNIFKKSKELDNLLMTYEDNNFGFIACIIDKNAKYSPFAYIHYIVDNKLFVPTKHYHEHDQRTNYMGRNSFNDNQVINNSEYTTDWDHDIFIFNTSKSNAYTNYENDKKYSFSQYIDNCPKEKLYKMNIKGYHKNEDIVIDLPNFYVSSDWFKNP